MIRYKPIEIHQEQITLLQEQMRNRKKKIALCQSKNPSNTLRNSDFKKKLENIDLSHLNQILYIDPEKKLLVVEPKITIKKLMNLLLKHDLMLAVVPEFSSITIGGAIMGTSLESSSHRYGQFNDLCIEYELLLGDGSMVKASQKENSDLFYGIVGSYGSLALLTAVTVKVIEAKKYVHLTYTRFWNYHKVVDHLRTSSHHDFFEGVILSKTWGITIEGSLTNESNHIPINKQGRFYKPWFYQHLLRMTKKGKYEEIMLLKDYLFRFDRGAFWMGKFVSHFKLLLSLLLPLRTNYVANAISQRTKKYSLEEGPSLWLRALFFPILSSKKLYKIWHKVPNSVSESLFFIQDFYTPISQTETLLQKCMDKTQIYPIWLCPIKNTTQGQFLSPHYNEERMINIGLYGIPQVRIPIPTLTKKLEKEIHQGKGRKMLYSYTYYDKDLFSKIYDSKSYEKLRHKYKATNAFLDLYSKVKNIEL